MNGWISLVSEAVGCAECGESTDTTHRLSNESGQHVGWLCEDCYAEAETPESLALLNMERVAYQ